jgi:hypothetical protein
MNQTAPIKPSQAVVFSRFMRRYFHDYGGLAAVLGSPLFLASVLISGLSYRSWITNSWTSLVESVIPNLLGFSLGTYALLFSLISPRIRLALRTLKNQNDVRYLDEMNATFLHFIIVQIICFLWSFLYKQSLFYDLSQIIANIAPSPWNLFPYMAAMGGFMGVSLLIYSVLLVIGSSLTVYRIARIIDPDVS